MRAKYTEGDWFAVPLQRGGWAIGRIARLKKPIVLGYFFGPRRDVLPSLVDLATLRPTDAIYIKLFSYLGLRDGDWPILGGLEEWHRAEWPMPEFGNREPGRGKMWRVTYDDARLEQIRGVQLVEEEEFLSLPRDGLGGAVYVENILSKMLLDG